jgi:hypothetical protein
LKIYIGNVGAKNVINLMKSKGWGRVHLANSWRYPEVGVPWILDNGAFSYWKNNLPFDEKRFEDALIKTELSKIIPDFVVVPDMVMQGYDSLDFSMKWLNRIPAAHNCFLAVQDGMEVSVIEDVLDLFDGIFVGGSLEWKLKSSSEWVTLAHKHKKPCHVGRVGTFRRLVWAKSIGVDSIDSSTFVHARQGRRYARIDAATEQTILHDFF